MEAELTEGKTVWIKMPYGDFVVSAGTDVVLFAGGSGISAFSAFLDNLDPHSGHSVALAYGARSSSLLIYRDLVESCVARISSLSVRYFVEDLSPAETAHAPRANFFPGRVSVEAMWPTMRSMTNPQCYISGPPAMLKKVGDDLRQEGVPAAAIHIDAWE